MEKLACYSFLCASSLPWPRVHCQLPLSRVLSCSAVWSWHLGKLTGSSGTIQGWSHAAPHPPPSKPLAGCFALVLAHLVSVVMVRGQAGTKSASIVNHLHYALLYDYICTTIHRIKWMVSDTDSKGETLKRVKLPGDLYNLICNNCKHTPEHLHITPL